MIIQLNPQLPVVCPKGKGYAFAMIDYSQEHDIIFVIALDESGEIWSYRNHEVRLQKNISIGRNSESTSESTENFYPPLLYCD